MEYIEIDIDFPVQKVSASGNERIESGAGRRLCVADGDGEGY